MITKPEVFPESLRDSTGLGPDFPVSSGDRERGKHRPSKTPRLTVIAVSNDDGTVVASGLADVLNELLLYQKAVVHGLSLLTERDLLKDVS